MVKIRNGMIVADDDEHIEREGLLSQGSSSDNPSHIPEEAESSHFLGTGRTLGTPQESNPSSTILPLDSSQSSAETNPSTSNSWTQTAQTQFQSFVNTIQSNSVVRNIQQFLFMDLSFFGLFNFKVIYFVVLSILLGFIFGWQSLLISFIFIIVLYFCAAARNFNMTQEQRVQQQPQEQNSSNRPTSGRTLGRTGNIHTLH